MRNPATTAYLTDLTKHESMPQPLGAWCGTEIDCGLSTLDRLALASALEGCCGIPPMHRETKTDPAHAALALMRVALEALHHWWPRLKRSEAMSKATLAATEGKTADLLTGWCMLRATERAKRATEADHSLAAA